MVNAVGDPGQLVVHFIAGHQSTDCSAARIYVFREFFEINRDVIRIVVESFIIDEFARRALAALDLSCQIFGITDSGIQIIVERLIIEQASDRALALPDSLHNVV